MVQVPNKLIQILTMLSNVIDTRRQFYEQYKDIFCWYDVDNYACYDVLEVAPSTIERVRRAAASVWQVLTKAGEVMKRFDDQTLVEEFDYPEETLRLIRSNTQAPFIARCDFALTDDDIYLLECNAEVATFVVETFKMNGIVVNHFGKADPNINAESVLKRELNKYIEESARYLDKAPDECNIVFAALSKAPEDIGTVEYLRSLCKYSSRFCAVENLEMDEDYCYDDTGEIVDVIYRIYPTEWMVSDEDPKLGVGLWNYFEPLIYARKVALINPVSSFVLQNKALMALITELGSDFFSTDGLDCRNFLPTFMAPDQIKPPYVAKPTWGREGREVQIIKGADEVITNPDPEYTHYAKVYQQYVDLPCAFTEGEEYKLQLSCFLINGIPEGVAARIGKDVISNNSKFIPIGY
ncbi:glutathionylspermidine synthase [Dulcicalothrix desertica PCC 7102]|uniref:Glutathionylspermidine synthase n=2 Tax=Dulcicalothrix desertica TaxID=32056 RepID=A0A433UJE5_9CYAN|nr:glutathionylspermidine synthase [Dulcicalothrix desertica PCC 7102]